MGPQPFDLSHAQQREVDERRLDRNLQKEAEHLTETHWGECDRATHHSEPFKAKPFCVAESSASTHFLHTKDTFDSDSIRPDFVVAWLVTLYMPWNERHSLIVVGSVSYRSQKMETKYLRTVSTDTLGAFVDAPERAYAVSCAVKTGVTCVVSTLVGTQTNRTTH